MTTLPEYYPFAQLPLATLLEWAHLAEPPFDEMRAAAPWLTRDGEVGAYLEGALRGRVELWQAGLLTEGDRWQ